MARRLGGVYTAVCLTALSAIAMAGPAAAEKVPSAEQGDVPFLVSASAAGAAGGVRSAAPGETLVTFTARPADAVRLDTDVVRRVRPNAGAAIPSGTILFGVRLATGTAYCPPLDLDDPVPRVQCLRDFNADFDFDAGYLAEARGLDTRYGAALLRGLGPAGVITYSTAEPSELPEVPVHVVFLGADAETARFRIRVEDEELDDVVRCDFTAESCRLVGARFALAPDGVGGITATRVDDAETASFTVRFTGVMRRR